MDLCQIFRDLRRHFREHNGFVQLEPGDFQMGYIFHGKDQVFGIIEIQFRNVFGNNDPGHFHVVIFQGSTVQGHVM